MHLLQYSQLLLASVSVAGDALYGLLDRVGYVIISWTATEEIPFQMNLYFHRSGPWSGGGGGGNLRGPQLASKPATTQPDPIQLPN